MKYLTQIENDYHNAEEIQKLLHFSDTDLYYVISDEAEYDDAIIPFKHLMEEVYKSGILQPSL